jgi:uncharacterized membrane protein YraQ (UPF0718 family)
VNSVAADVPFAASPSTRRRNLALQTLVAALLSLGMALYFWLDSRYPALLKKLHSGKGIGIKGALSFDALMPVTPAMSLITRIGHTTVNWMWTNRVGMTFGICFGAAMLTLLPMLPGLRFRGAAANTLLGTVTGIPLGVCANCVAPIGRGLYTAGASPNTVVATMISSPLLNVVVLAMAFTLFPLKIALVRLAAPLVLLALVPWIVRRAEPFASPECALPVASGWFRPTTGTFELYLKNLGKLALATVPLMIVAAVLGALVAELVPTQAIPAHVSIVGILLIALIGTFLPVPMAFDVAAAFILMTRGVPMPYVVTLLCTLGAFSIYPFLIVGRSISWRTALRLFAAVFAVGMVAGLITAAVQHSF